MTTAPNGNGMPPWAKALSAVGFPTLVAAYLLGMIPGLASPISSMLLKLDAHAAQMAQYDRAAREQLRVTRHMCRALWRGDVVMQGACGDQTGAGDFP